MDESMTSDRGIFSCLPNELVNMIVDRIDSIDALLRLKMCSMYWCLMVLIDSTFLSSFVEMSVKDSWNDNDVKHQPKPMVSFIDKRHNCFLSSLVACRHILARCNNIFRLTIDLSSNAANENRSVLQLLINENQSISQQSAFNSFTQVVTRFVHHYGLIHSLNSLHIRVHYSGASFVHRLIGDIYIFGRCFFAEQQFETTIDIDRQYTMDCVRFDRLMDGFCYDADKSVDDMAGNISIRNCNLVLNFKVNLVGVEHDDDEDI